MPSAIMPMLATLVKTPVRDDNYVYEVKWDGYRIIAFCRGSNVKLQSRGGENYTNKYPTVVKQLKAMNLSCILDGEVIYTREDGTPDFDALQRVNGQNAPLVYYVFDLLWINGHSVMEKELLDRK